MASAMKKPWSRKFARCVRCGKTESPHGGNGWCRRCYLANFKKNPPVPRPPGGHHFKVANQLFERGLNTNEIAKAIGLTHQGVSWLVRQNPTWGKTVPRTCQRCGRQYLGARGTHLCSKCTSGERAECFCPKCGKRMNVSSKLCLRCHKRQLFALGSPEQCRLAKRLRRQGWSYDRIAIYLHYSPMAVWRAINGRPKAGSRPSRSQRRRGIGSAASGLAQSAGVPNVEREAAK